MQVRDCTALYYVNHELSDEDEDVVNLEDHAVKTVPSQQRAAVETSKKVASVDLVSVISAKCALQDQRQAHKRELTAIFNTYSDLGKRVAHVPEYATATERRMQQAIYRSVTSYLAQNKFAVLASAAGSS